MLTYVYVCMQATPEAIKKPIHEADLQSHVKVNKYMYIDNRLLYST